MVQVIEERFANWQEQEFDEDTLEPSEVAHAIMEYLDCECTYFPSNCFKSSYSENMMTSCAIMMNGRFSAPVCCLWMRILFIMLMSMMMAK